ncbi:MAG: FAD-dependent oxidoreductase [Candidatus Latescibacteria bacterium]|nr:FAD-dependent oxidoreductase [Candidatus Latescibacterota bacterium]
MNTSSIENNYVLPVEKGREYDVIVMGGGVSGSIAGIASARHGAKTLVIERHGFLGGALTAMGVGPMMSFHNRAGKQLVKGIPQEIIDRLKAKNASPGHIPDSTTYCSTVTPFDCEQLKIELETMLIESGGEIQYHTQLAHVEKKDNKIESVVVCNNNGLTQFGASVYIDATGDADLAKMAGVQCTIGRGSDAAMQPMTMNLKTGNVDIESIRAYVKNNPGDFRFAFGAEEGLRRLEKTPRLSLAGYLSEWDAAVDNGELDIPRDLVLFFETATSGVVIVNTTRIQSLNPTIAEDISRAETIGRQQCSQLFTFLKKHCTGFEHAVNLGTSVHIGIRESRHIRGLYTLTAEDLIQERQFHDPVAMGGYPIDIHSPDKAETVSTHLRPECAYRIPERCMLVEKPDNLIVVGRAVSATHEASAAIRVSPIAMAVGQAGGTLAALAVVHRIGPNMVPYSELRNTLLSDNVILP